MLEMITVYKCYASYVLTYLIEIISIGRYINFKYKDILEYINII